MVEMSYQTMSLSAGQRAGETTGIALKLFRQVRRAAQAARVWSALSGRSNELQSASGARRGGQAGRRIGAQAVPITSIRGSEGRSADFDAAFRPLNEHTRSRWLSVATARLNGTALPRVQLVQIGGAYYVRDGHHRISVARALGEEFVEAEVTAGGAA